MRWGLRGGDVGSLERSQLPSLWERDWGEGWLAGAHPPLRRLLPPAMPKGGRENARLSTSYGAAPFSPREKGTRTRLALSLSGRASFDIILKPGRQPVEQEPTRGAVFRSRCMASHTSSVNWKAFGRTGTSSGVRRAMASWQPPMPTPARSAASWATSLSHRKPKSSRASVFANSPAARND